MSNNQIALLILAGVVVLVVLNMTSSHKSSKVVANSAKRSVSSSPKKERFSYTEGFDSLELENFDNKVGPGTPGSPKAEFVIKSAKLGNDFGGGKFVTKLTGAGGNVGPNTTNVNGLSLDGSTNIPDFTLGVTPVINKERKDKKLSAKDLLPKESKDDWFDMPYDKKQMMRIENENLLAGASTQSRVGIDTQGQTLKNASHDLRAAPPNPKFMVSPWNNSTIEPDYNIKPIM
jgi:hypothetical protein